MERELEAFLADYYPRVVPLCEKLEIMRCRLVRHPFTKNHDIAAPTKNCAIEHQIKALYRKLIKAYHPDNNHAHDSTHIIKIIKAYDENNLGKLWQMSIEHTCKFINDNTQLARYLEEERKEIANILRDVKARRNEILANPEWILKEKVFEKSLHGIDLIGHITSELETQIESVQKMLRKKIALAMHWPEQKTQFA